MSEKRGIGPVVVGGGAKYVHSPVQIVAMPVADKKTVAAKIKNSCLLALGTIVVVSPHRVPGTGKPRGHSRFFKVGYAIAQKNCGIGRKSLCPV